jgi:hypothetical protein
MMSNFKWVLFQLYKQRKLWTNRICEKVALEWVTCQKFKKPSNGPSTTTLSKVYFMCNENGTKGVIRIRNTMNKGKRTKQNDKQWSTNISHSKLKSNTNPNKSYVLRQHELCWNLTCVYNHSILKRYIVFSIENGELLNYQTMFGQIKQHSVCPFGPCILTVFDYHFGIFKLENKTVKAKLSTYYIILNFWPGK